MTLTPRELEEYGALRATIRERGTARVWLFTVGLALWAALALAAAWLMPAPVTTLTPLLVLAATFEGVFALHTGVERVGRYLQVFYESEDGEAGLSRRWEHQAMAFGQPAGSSRIDPLFSLFFGLAAAANFLPAVLAGAVPIEWSVVGALHLLFVGRLVDARRRAARQRAVDLQRFQQLKNS